MHGSYGLPLTLSLLAHTDSSASMGMSYESQGRVFASFACWLNLTSFCGHPDDHFPPISHILGLNPKGPNDTMSSSSRPFISTHTRSSLRATTYDGKVIHIGRKRHIGTTQKARFEHVLPTFFYAHGVQTSCVPTQLN